MLVDFLGAHSKIFIIPYLLVHDWLDMIMTLPLVSFELFLDCPA